MEDRVAVVVTAARDDPRALLADEGGQALVDDGEQLVLGESGAATTSGPAGGASDETS
ncbi:hypothetical protein Q0F99_15010 [Rathayibacter oskolensis]|uniref:hypothetical protein n=1 Tax=Rathayibacter oskolensis TaxID=1891671 RepID=UPI00265E043E|nr:hypothetical protein [Rathayibacter oskolensis]WKK70991.1 hypothetical protein Q0F99_15010 [Rathayibacter oskolensis]